MDGAELTALAVKARDYAYAPYSGFKVGAALLCENGKIYTGCNIENAAFSPSNCAERTAFFKAVSEGERKFTAIAVAGWKDGNNGFAFPCGVCRQVMAEFCDVETFRIIVADGGGNNEARLLSQLLPDSFGPNNI
jgi:cytidine deaminase